MSREPIPSGPVRVRDLLQRLQVDVRTFPAELLDRTVLGVTSDSRQVAPGFVFVAVRGGSQDGHDFIAQVREAGAILCVGERPRSAYSGQSYLEVPSSRRALAMLASRFYGDPSHGMKMVGVTGTSGKTTTTYLIESVLKAAGHAVGVIGTVNFRFGEKVYPSTHTTPGAVELQKLLSEMRRDGCTAVVMEVSSHALKQDRSAFIAFDGVVFTNLTPEHLDFHPDMEDYYASKKILFTEYLDVATAAGKKPVAAINIEDEYGRRLLEECRAHPVAGSRYLSFTATQGQSGDFTAQALRIDLGGIQGETQDVKIRSGLTGRFNAANILGALTVARGMGIDPAAVSRGISELAAVPGRLERVPNSRGIHVVVDYAHKPDALEKVLTTLVEVKGEQRLITVFGCGGDRDRKKRPVMGEMAVRLSDHVFVTSDNPRTEDPTSIIDEILRGAPGAKNLTVEPDRRKAIFGAIAMAKKGDLVLIAGKGHEDCQIIGDPSAPSGTRKIHFDDREVATEALSP